MSEGRRGKEMDRCPHIKGSGIISRKWEITDYCELSEKPSGRIHPCVLISGEVCEEWELIKREEEWFKAGINIKEEK